VCRVVTGRKEWVSTDREKGQGEGDDKRGTWSAK
jgi:hypothetical protein